MRAVEVTIGRGKTVFFSIEPTRVFTHMYPILDRPASGVQYVYCVRVAIHNEPSSTAYLTTAARTGNKIGNEKSGKRVSKGMSKTHVLSSGPQERRSLSARFPSPTQLKSIKLRNRRTCHSVSLPLWSANRPAIQGSLEDLLPSSPVIIC